MSVFATGIGVAFAAMGVGAMARPDRVTTQFGIPPLTVDGRNEVRAVYGGFGLAMAAMLVGAGMWPALSRGIVLTVAAALGGMAAGRVVSAAIDRRFGRMPMVYFGIEAVAAGVLFGMG